MRDEAQEFLESAENKNTYLVLEGGEVFAMAAESFIEENQKLLAELADLEPQTVKAIAEIEARL